MKKKIALKVGKEFIIIPKNRKIKIEKTNSKVIVNKKEYFLYKGENFYESIKIEKFFDDKDYIIYKIKDHLKK